MNLIRKFTFGPCGGQNHTWLCLAGFCDGVICFLYGSGGPPRKLHIRLPRNAPTPVFFGVKFGGSQNIPGVKFRGTQVCMYYQYIGTAGLTHFSCWVCLKIIKTIVWEDEWILHNPTMANPILKVNIIINKNTTNNVTANKNNQPSGLNIYIYAYIMYIYMYIYIFLLFFPYILQKWGLI